MDIELSADTLEGVETLVEDLHRDIVASLCLVTQCPIQVSGLRKIVDWRLGLHRRAITFYRNIGGLKVSLPALKEGHIESAMALNKLVKDDRLKRAMQFFRRGISARYSDEQFENFYFSVEILATRSMKKKLLNVINVNKI